MSPRTWSVRPAPMCMLALVLSFGSLVGCTDLVPESGAPPLLPPPGDPSWPSPEDPDLTPAEDAPVTITSVDPEEGPVGGGIDVLILGTGFRAGLEVLFGESPGSDLFVVSSTAAVVRLPPRPAGRVDVTVFHPRANAEPDTLPGAFRYFDTIAITHLDPVDGTTDGGIPIAVYGSGFTPDTTIYFDGRPALSQAVIDNGLVRGILPPGRYGEVAVHAVGINGTAARPLGFLYVRPPILSGLSPVVGHEGTLVTLLGEGLGEDSEVTFGGNPAEVKDTTRDGRMLVAVAPGPAVENSVVDVSVATRAGVATMASAFAYRADDVDPLILTCSHIAPASGSEAGGTRVEIACHGLAYGSVRVRFGSVEATLVEVDEAGGRLVATAPPGAGEVVVTVSTSAAGPVTAGRFVYLEPSPLALTSVTPSSGPLEGGTLLELNGRGFSPGMSVTVGALTATAITVIAPDRATVRTPPGAAGLADVVVRASGLTARLEGAFDYTSERLGLSLISPSVGAQAGGTRLRILGEGFTPTTQVVIGGEPCPPIAFVSSAELHVRSPRLPVGVHDAEVSGLGPAPDDEGPVGPTEPRRALRERLFTSFDPRSGTGGTWGPPIDGTLNVTVWGSGGYGPVEGAFVLVGHDPQGPWRGFTNDAGQVTISEPGLYGPVEVTASRDGFTAYSVVRFDAENVTVLLSQNPTPPPSSGSGSGNPGTLPPNAVLRGRVIGLDKYVVAPPGSCEALAIPETSHCAACDPALPDGGCGGDPGFACIDFQAPGTGVDQFRCAAACEAGVETCPAGYTCAASSAGARCLPSPGTRRAYCNVTSTSLFGYEYPIQTRGWVDDAGTFELDSRRLGDMAIYCFGGYQDDQGLFLPTVMGVRRQITTTAGAQMNGLDVGLNHPLTRSFRFRLEDPPLWSAGLQPPNLVISLDLGPDGVIPFSRALVPIGVGVDRGDPLWVAPNQLTSLSGPLYDATYFLYTTLAPANNAGFQPRSYNLVQYVQSIVEDRFPVRDAAGWRLEGSQVAVDLYGAFMADDAEGTRVWAVGEKGRILLFSGVSWSAQTSGTAENLNAIHGTGGRDVWAVGDAGTVRHWDGVAWNQVTAPFDDFGAVLATPTTVYAAGRVRLRALDRATNTWSVIGGPTLQEVRALIETTEGIVATATGGRVFLLDTTSPTGGSATRVPLPVTSTLRAGIIRQQSGSGSELVLVGDDGVIVRGDSVATLAVVTSPTTQDLTALTEEADGTLIVVGDNGVALRGQDAASLFSETIPDYRSKAHGVVSLPDGTTRVVGSAAFILGPFLHFPIITAPLHEMNLVDLVFGWTFTGPANQYTRLALTPDASITVWTLIVDGGQTTATLPDLQAAAGLAPLAGGRYRLEVLRVLNRNFDIDAFSTRDFNTYARDSWSTNEAWFVLP